LRTGGVNEAMAVAFDVSPADFPAQFDQLGLGGSLVHQEEDVDLIERVHGLHGDVVRVSRPDADNEYLLHGTTLRCGLAHPIGAANAAAWQEAAAAAQEAAGASARIANEI